MKLGLYRNRDTGRVVRVVKHKKSTNHLRYRGQLAVTTLGETTYVADPKARLYRVGLARFRDKFEALS